ncbi:MAG: AAA family ATPase [Bacteroidota bacterium]
MAHIITFLVVLASFFLLPANRLTIKKFLAKLLGRRSKTNGELFDNNYIDIKSFYLQEFGIIPCMTYISGIKVESAFEFIHSEQAGKVKAVYQSSYYSWADKKLEFSRTIFQLENKVMIELGYDHARILFDSGNHNYAEQLGLEFVPFRSPEKTEAFEINIITVSDNSLQLKQMEITQVQLDLGLYYNDDFASVDELIRERLNKENDKGIILLHGLPGTGKTTYLRHLIGQMNKKVMFVSPAVAENLMNPEFVDLLIDNPNAVLIIEDAENVLMDRKFGSKSGVSNLLNISDGLLSDCLNVQIICTFNNPISTVDGALLRKGRLIAKYEFGKLNVGKAQALSDHLGFSHKIDQPMTLAEISNPGEKEIEHTSTRVAGFRREAVMN